VPFMHCHFALIQANQKYRCHLAINMQLYQIAKSITKLIKYY
jgi:hypothetical protein